MEYGKRDYCGLSDFVIDIDLVPLYKPSSRLYFGPKGRICSADVVSYPRIPYNFFCQTFISGRLITPNRHTNDVTLLR